MPSMHVREVLGRGIARLRQERGLTQEQLAERLDVSTQFLAAIERAKKTPSFDTLETVCQVFGVAPSVRAPRHRDRRDRGIVITQIGAS